MVAPSPEPPVPETTADIGQYLAVLRARKWTVILVTGLVVGGAMLYSFRQTPMYESTAKILVKPITVPAQSNQINPIVNMSTEQEIARSTEVAAGAGDEILPPESPEALQRDLEVTVPPDTQVLDITFSDPSPLRAQDGASAFADAYLGYKTEQANAAIDERRRPLEGQIADLTDQIRTLDQGGPGSQSERDVLVSQLAVLRSQLAPLSAVVIDPGDVIEPAGLPSSAASPDHLLNAGLALFVGILLGVGLAFLRERLDDRLQGRNDLELRSGAPVLAVVPKVPGWRKRKRTKLVTMEEPKSPAAEAYRTLRTGILFIAAQRGLETLMVASGASGEGKTTTVANLGVVLAQAGKRVVVVSGDLRKPRLHRFFGLDNRVGVVNYLAGEVPLADALMDPGVENLRVLMSGPIPTAPAEILGSDAMGELLAELRTLADFVLVDTPAVLAVSDALTIIPLTDGVLYVADAEATSRGALAHARSQLDQVAAVMVGSVLNGFDPSKARAYPYYRYYYQYRYAYGEPEGIPYATAPGTSREELPRRAPGRG